MRHLYTLIAAVVIAPLAWVLLAFGEDRSAQAFANAHSDGSFDTGDFVRPIALLVAAGLLLGLLATLRFSPLGVVLAGAGYAASYLALLFNPDRVLSLFPNNVSLAGHSADPTLPLRTGTAMLLGTMMVLALVSIGRWRRWPSASAEEPEPQPTPEPGEERPLGIEGLGLSRSTQIAEPDLVIRYASSPRRAGVNGPVSFGPPDNSTEQWQGQTTGQFNRPRV